MLISLIIICSICVLYILFANMKLKKKLNIPWYYRAISLDIQGKKGKFFEYKGIIGVPDAVFKHILLPKYIVAELKGRSIDTSGYRKHELGQIMLYLGIVKKTGWFRQVKGKLVYKNKQLDVSYCKHTFNEIVTLKKPALAIVKKLT